MRPTVRASHAILFAAAAVLAAAATPAAAADGKALFTDKGCPACHGEDAKTPLQEAYPKLAGQNADYVFQELKDIKSGARANGLIPDTMKPVIADISEPDLRALADYIGSLPRFTPDTAKGDADAPGHKLFLTKTCVACHGKDGTKPVLKYYPYLAGQDKAYIVTQMADIKSGKRANGAVAAMQPVMHLVTDQEIDAIAEYLSNVK
jgi:cytochrome c553